MVLLPWWAAVALSGSVSIKVVATFVVSFRDGLLLV
jgi:hypothetical protein